MSDMFVLVMRYSHHKIGSDLVLIDFQNLCFVKLFLPFRLYQSLPLPPQPFRNPIRLNQYLPCSSLTASTSSNFIHLALHRAVHHRTLYKLYQPEQLLDTIDLSIHHSERGAASGFRLQDLLLEFSSLWISLLRDPTDHHHEGRVYLFWAGI